MGNTRSANSTPGSPSTTVARSCSLIMSWRMYIHLEKRSLNLACLRTSLPCSLEGYCSQMRLYLSSVPTRNRISSHSAALSKVKWGSWRMMSKKFRSRLSEGKLMETNTRRSLAMLCTFKKKMLMSQMLTWVTMREQVTWFLRAQLFHTTSYANTLKWWMVLIA